MWITQTSYYNNRPYFYQRKENDITQSYTLLYN